MPDRARSRFFAVSAALVGVLVASLGVGTAPTANAAAVPVPTIVILDASGSMVRDAAGGGSRMDQAKQAVIDMAKGLPEGTEVGLLVFGTGTGNSDAEQQAGCSDIRELVPVGPIDAAEFTKQVNGVVPSGFTPLGPAMREAVARMPEGKPANIVLVSDGVDTCSPPPACEIASDLRVTNDELTIHVVGFAVDDDEAARGQLQCIGAVGGGTYVEARDAEQLTARLSAAVVSTAGSDDLNVLGANNVRLGESLDQIRAKLGENARIVDEQTVDNVKIIWIECDWGTVIIRDNIVVGISSKGTNQTPEGVQIGGSLDDATAIYGDAVDTGTDRLGDYSVYPINAGFAPAYKLYTDGGKITYIVLCLCAPVAIELSEIAQWEVTADGVGPIALGSNIDDVLAIFPGAQGVDGYDGRTKVWTLISSPDNPWARLAVSTDITTDEIVLIEVGDRWRNRDTYGANAGGEATMPSAAGYILPHLGGLRIGDSGTTAANVYEGMTIISTKLAGSDRRMVTDREGRVISIFTELDFQSQGNYGAGMIVAFTIEDGSRWESYTEGW